jgi:antitoxin MazE
MSHITVGRWGKSLAIRFPGDIAAAAGLREGEQVAIDMHGDEIIVRRAAPRFNLDEMFRGRSPEEWRADYAAAFDWGPDIGREAMEE